MVRLPRPCFVIPFHFTKCSAPNRKSFGAERKINLRRLKNHSAENEKSFGADFYDVNYQVVANCLPNVFFRSGT